MMTAEPPSKTEKAWSSSGVASLHGRGRALRRYGQGRDDCRGTQNSMRRRAMTRIPNRIYPRQDKRGMRIGRWHSRSGDGGDDVRSHGVAWNNASIACEQPATHVGWYVQRIGQRCDDVRTSIHQGGGCGSGHDGIALHGHGRRNAEGKSDAGRIQLATKSSQHTRIDTGGS